MIPLLSALAILAAPGAPWDASVLHRAMSDELTRNMDSLALAGTEQPYYLEYRVRDWHSVVVRAEFGAVVNDQEDRGRRVWVDLRVGTPEFDNTDFMGRTGVVGAPSVNLCLDDDYGALRNALWLATDGAYKKALEDLAQKEAYAENRTIEDYPGDLSPAEPSLVLLEESQIQGDPEAWRDLAIELSAVFKRYPRIQESGVSLAARATNQHFLNSEGSRHVRSGSGVVLTAVAYGQCSDGMKVGDRVVSWWEFGEEPSSEVLLDQIEQLAQRVSELTQAPRGEDYVGPVVFTGPGAGEFWAQVMLANLSSPRTPLGLASLGAAGNEAALVRKLHRRILPQGIDAYDDPTLESFRGHDLLGSYSVDDDGVLPQRVDLVKGGRLSDLLMSRIPTKDLHASNGHGRGSGRWVDAQPSNTVIIDRDAVTNDSLLQELSRLGAASELPYGYVVEEASAKWWVDAGPSGWYMASWPYHSLGAGTLLGDPVTAYRVWFEEGRKELVRGLEFSDVTVRSLKDIVSAGSSPVVHDYLTGPRGGLPDEPATVVAPPVLLEEAELRRKELEEATIPYLPHPSFQ
jgi:TldD protein